MELLKLDGRIGWGRHFRRMQTGATKRERATIAAITQPSIFIIFMVAVHTLAGGASCNVASAKLRSVPEVCINMGEVQMVQLHIAIFCAL